MSLTWRQYDVIFQGYIVLLALAGAVSDGSQRDRSILTALFLWAGWVFCTDQFGLVIHPVLITWEAAAFSGLVLWAIVRPYLTPSHHYNPHTVCLAFYHGDNAPLLSSLSALIGLPFASVTILANGKALHPVKRGWLTIADAGVYARSHSYTIIDTGIKPDKAFDTSFANANCSSTKVGPLRIGCLRALRPVLDHINLAPHSIFQYIPSVFFYHAVRLVK